MILKPSNHSVYQKRLIIVCGNIISRILALLLFLGANYASWAQLVQEKEIRIVMALLVL